MTPFTWPSMETVVSDRPSAMPACPHSADVSTGKYPLAAQLPPVVEIAKRTGVAGGNGGGTGGAFAMTNVAVDYG